MFVAVSAYSCYNSVRSISRGMCHITRGADLSSNCTSSHQHVERGILLRFAIYSRKSKFTGKGESVENQVQLCREYLDRTIDDNDKAIEIFEDEGFSGKNTNRPEFQRMIAAVEKREFDYIVCYRLDRISRSVSDFSLLIESLSKLGVEFICIREQFDTTNPMGRAMMHIASVFAQLERETIAERIRDNMLMLARTGRWLGGHTPFGFESAQLKNMTVDGKTRTSFMLSTVPAEITIVRQIFDLYSENHSLTKIETYFAQSGIKTRGGKTFKTIGIREILSNPVYCVADEAAFDYFYEQGASISGEKKDFSGRVGVAAYNRTNSKSTYQKKQPITEWVIAVGKHEGIIESSIWIKVQKHLSLNKLTYNFYKPQNPVALLSGVLVCAKCGSPMRPRVSSYREYKKGQPYDTRTYTYKCELKRMSKRVTCDCPDINGNVLDKIICEELMNYKSPDSSVGRQLANLRSGIDDTGGAARKKARMLEQRITEKSAEIKKMIYALAKEADNSYLHEYIKQEVEELGSQITAMKQELFMLEQETKQTDDFGSQYEIIEGALELFTKTFDIASVEEKRAFIKSIIQKITWDGEEVDIFLSGESKQQG